MLLVVLASLLYGAGPVSASDAMAALMANGTEEAWFVVTELRLPPRTIIALATGLALGLAGALLQSMTRNPLAEPGLLGVSAGSSFAVAWPSSWAPPQLLSPPWPPSLERSPAVPGDCRYQGAGPGQ